MQATLIRHARIFLGGLLCIGTLAWAAPTQAPSWQLQGPQGNTVNFPEDAQSKPTVLLFWPSWCPYSRALQPYVQAIWEDYGERINVWTINILEKADPVEAMRERGLSFPLLLDGDPLMQPYGISRTPWLVVMNGDNRIVYTRPANPGGPVAVAKKVRKTLNALLGEKAVPLPASYPEPYDLHLKGHSSQVPQSKPQAPKPEVWGPWARQYLAGIGPNEQVAGEQPRGPVADGKTAIAHAREIWTDHYGEQVVHRQAPHRAYRIDDRWVVVGTTASGQLGDGLILAIGAENGRILRIENGQ